METQCETAIGVIVGYEACAPVLVGKRWIGHHIVKGLQRLTIFKQGSGEHVAALDFRRGIAVQHHIHAGKALGGYVLFLSVEGHLGGSRFPHLEQKGAGAACWVV